MFMCLRCAALADVQEEVLMQSVTCLPSFYAARFFQSLQYLPGSLLRGDAGHLLHTVVPPSLPSQDDRNPPATSKGKGRACDFPETKVQRHGPTSQNPDEGHERWGSTGRHAVTGFVLSNSIRMKCNCKPCLRAQRGGVGARLKGEGPLFPFDQFSETVLGWGGTRGG